MVATIVKKNERGAVLQVGNGIRSILKNGGYLAGAAWIEIGLRTIYLLFITRMLGPDLYGVWAYVIATYGLAVGMVSFGSETLLPRQLGATKANADSYTGTALTLRLSLQLLVTDGLVFFAFLALPEGTTRTVLLLSVPAFFGRGLSIWARAIFVGYERTPLHVRLTTVFRCLEVLCGIAALVLGGGLVALILVHSLFWSLEAIAGILQIRRHLTPLRPRIDRAFMVDMVRQGIALGMASALGAWMLAGPIVLLRHESGDLAIVGQVALALQFTTLLVASSQPFLAAALPILSRSAKMGDPRVATYGRASFLAAMAGTICLAIIAQLLGPGWLVWLIGPEFELAGRLLPASALIAGLIVAPAGYSQYLFVHGYKWHGVIGASIGALVLAGGLPYAAEHFGAGAAMWVVILAWLIRAIAISALGAREIRRQKRASARGGQHGNTRA